jgi:hypothetical protein
VSVYYTELDHRGIMISVYWTVNDRFIQHSMAGGCLINVV